jgi:nicotinamidase-related amidase
VVVAGLRANTCVEATARHAVELGYHVTIVKDATAAFRPEEWSATIEVNAPTFAHSIVTTESVISGDVPRRARS